MTAAALAVVAWIAAFIVLAEALNKLHRLDLFGGEQGWRPRALGLARLFVPWRWRQKGVEKGLKAMAWALLSVASAGYLVTPFIGQGGASLPDQMFTAGFALLIVRSRIKEG